MSNLLISPTHIKETSFEDLHSRILFGLEATGMF